MACSFTDAATSRWNQIDHRLRCLELAIRWAGIETKLSALQSKISNASTSPAASPSPPGSIPTPGLGTPLNNAAIALQASYSAQDRSKGAGGVSIASACPPSPTQARLQHELQGRGISEYRFVRVPKEPEYYEQPLEYRQGVLDAASIDHLCKSIIMTNTRAHPSIIDEADPLAPTNWADPCNSRYYVIIVQYTARLNADKLAKVIHGMANQGGKKVGKQFFNMRLAPEDVNDALSGFSHNAVSPVGMAHELPMIISHRIMDLGPDFFWMGGGEVDLKLGLHPDAFRSSYQPFVADITY